jgi:hypothetical protein
MTYDHFVHAASAEGYKAGFFDDSTVVGAVIGGAFGILLLVLLALFLTTSRGKIMRNRLWNQFLRCATRDPNHGASDGLQSDTRQTGVVPSSRTSGWVSPLDSTDNALQSGVRQTLAVAGTGVPIGLAAATAIAAAKPTAAGHNHISTESNATGQMGVSLLQQATQPSVATVPLHSTGIHATRKTWGLLAKPYIVPVSQETFAAPGLYHASSAAVGMPATSRSSTAEASPPTPVILSIGQHSARH